MAPGHVKALPGCHPTAGCDPNQLVAESARQTTRRPTSNFDDVTPPPEDPTEARAWFSVREQLKKVEVEVTGIAASVKEQVTELKKNDSEHAKSIGELKTSSALHTQSLSTIERGISEIKGQRSDDGTRFRFALQIVTSLLAALAAIAVSVIGIATR